MTYSILFAVLYFFIFHWEKYINIYQQTKIRFSYLIIWQQFSWHIHSTYFCDNYLLLRVYRLWSSESAERSTVAVSLWQSNFIKSVFFLTPLFRQAPIFSHLRSFGLRNFLVSTGNVYAKHLLVVTCKVPHCHIFFRKHWDFSINFEWGTVWNKPFLSYPSQN